MNTQDDDFKLQNYQDDLTTDDNVADPIIDEETDDPTEELGVNRNEFKKELDKYDFDEGGHGDDDRREEIEDLDQEIGDDQNER